MPFQIKQYTQKQIFSRFQATRCDMMLKIISISSLASASKSSDAKRFNTSM